MEMIEENKALKKQVLQETIRRLSTEQQLIEATKTLIQLRVPMVEQELSLALAKLKELTKESQDGPSGN